MIHYKTQEEIELMRESALLVSGAIAEVAKVLKAGMTTLQADAIAEAYILDHHAIPSFKNYNGYPYACCISVNDAVVHGFPNDTPLQDGDIVSVDVGAYKNSFHGDSAYTFAIGKASEDAKKLMRVTKESLLKGIEKAVSGNRIGDVAFAVQEHAEKLHRYGVVRELVGHGIGKSLHEDPQVPNYGKRGTGIKLQEGLVIAIEPMVNMGKKEIFYDDDEWTVRTIDRLNAVHYEHTVCIKKGKADVLSSFEEIERMEKANTYLDSSYY